jgi:hypothetical protein
MNGKTRPTSSDTQDLVDVTSGNAEGVIFEALAALGGSTADGPLSVDHPPAEHLEATDGVQGSTEREVAAIGIGLIGGEVGRRAIKDAIDRKSVVDAARRVASRQSVGFSDEQVLNWLLEKPGRIKMLGGHLHEMLDAKDLKQLAKLTGGRTRVLELYPAHNRPGLDGVYKEATRAGKKAVTNGAKPAKLAQHKLSGNKQAIKAAADKVCPQVRGKTEAVVARGTKKVAKEAVGDKMRVREAGRSLRDIHTMLERAADPAKVADIGKQSAAKLGAGAIGGAAGLSVGLSIAGDVKGLVTGEKSLGEAAENAAWAAGESAATATASVLLTAAAAESIAVGVTVLAGSSVAGTTLMAAGLATLGPIGLGIGCGIAIGFGVRKVRKATRG